VATETRQHFSRRELIPVKLEQSQLNSHEQQKNSQPWGNRPDLHLANAEPPVDQMLLGERRGRLTKKGG
jgi:hypothetical protein